MNANPTPSISAAQKDYRSPFQQWNESSWIRSKPLMHEDSFSGLPFPPELVPLTSHPEISEDSSHWLVILAYRLLEHLQFTSLVELNYVNPICVDLVQGKTPIDLTDEQRIDALKIYCDEGGHSLFMESFLKRVETTFGISRAVLGYPQFDLAFQKLLDSETRLSPNLIRLFLTNITETLYIGTYSAVPKDERIAPAVRTVIGDHVADEAVHYVYFRNLFPLLWNSLSAPEKEEVGQILPKLVRTFLEPDQTAACNILLHLGFTLEDADKILQEVYLPKQIAEKVRRVAKPTLKMFEEVGVFSILSVKQAFEDYQLLM